jgi:hypothetical protein
MNWTVSVLGTAIPIAFAMGWMLRPTPEPTVVPPVAAQPVVNANVARRRIVLPSPERSGNVEPSASSIKSTPARRPAFVKGEVWAWLDSLGGLRGIQSAGGADAVSAVLATLSDDEFAELDAAVQVAAKDPLRLRDAKLALRVLMLAWPARVARDPAATMASLKWASAHEPDVLDREMLEILFRRYAAVDELGAIDAVAGLPESVRVKAGQGILAEVVRYSPIAALELVPQLLGAGGDPRPIVETAAARYVKATAEWIKALPEGGLRQQSIAALRHALETADKASAPAKLEALQLE